jgi:response regulator of citrate/malate metabolism
MAQIFTALSSEDLTKLIEDAVDQSVLKSLQSSLESEEVIMSNTQVLEMLGISRTTLHSYVRRGIISCFKLGEDGKSYYHRGQIQEALFGKKKAGGDDE